VRLNLDLQKLAQITNDATFLDLPQNYWESVKLWAKAGYPVRSDKEVKRLLNTFCNAPGGPCERFDRRLGVFGFCKVCGCNINDSGVGWLNALKMATKGCPLGKFPPQVGKEGDF